MNTTDISFKGCYLKGYPPFVTEEKLERLKKAAMHAELFKKNDTIFKIFDRDTLELEIKKASKWTLLEDDELLVKYPEIANEIDLGRALEKAEEFLHGIPGYLDTANPMNEKVYKETIENMSKKTPEQLRDVVINAIKKFNKMFTQIGDKN